MEKEKLVSLEEIQERIDFINSMPSWGTTDEFDKGFAEAVSLIREIIEEMCTGNEQYLFFKNRTGK